MTPSTKILLVEDEPFLGQIVSDSLRSRGYDVHLETSGIGALNSLDDRMPDVILLDVMLPSMDGFEVATEVRKRDVNAPILFLTAKTETEDVLKGFEAGGDDYLRKPFAVEELIVRMEHLLRIKNASSQPADGELVLTMGDFTLQVRSQTLTHVPTGESRKLSHRENELMKMLHRHRSDMLPRKDVLISLWKDDSYFNSRNLDVYISKLRSHLKADPRVEIITLKGHGYRLVLPS
jgi:DNA-binding response OmpR family regulator